MKKSLLLLVLPLFLASCGMNESPDKVLMWNQKAIVWNISEISSDFTKWEQTSNLKFSIEPKMWQKVKFNLSSKWWFDMENKISWWNLSWEINWIWSWSGQNSLKFDLNILSSQKRIYTKINSTNDFDIWSLIWIRWTKLDSIMNKWLFLDLPKQNDFDVNKYKEFVNIANKYQIFKLSKKNEDKEFYNYDVVFNNDNIVSIANDVSVLSSWSWLTINEKKDMLDNLGKSNFKWNLKINPKNKEYFIFTSNIEKTTLKIENSKEIFSFEAIEEWNKNSFNISFKKDWKNLVWNIVWKSNGKETTKWNINIKLEKNTMNIDWLIDILEQWKISFDFNNTSDKNTKVVLEEPKDATNLQEAMMKIITWSMQQTTATWTNILANTWAISNTGSVKKIK